MPSVPWPQGNYIRCMLGTGGNVSSSVPTYDVLLPTPAPAPQQRTHLHTCLPSQLSVSPRKLPQTSSPLCPHAHPLQLHLVRDVTGEQFAEAINKSLAPRMQLAGEAGGRADGRAPIALVVAARVGA